MPKVFVTQPAEYDLIDIEYYIHVDLCNPQAADRIVDGIIKTIQELSNLPLRQNLVNDELLKSVGTRIIIFENYNIFYFYDEAKDSVHILRVLYNKVDWQNMFR